MSNYYTREFEKLKIDTKSEYLPQVKFYNNGNETHFLSLNNDAIKATIEFLESLYKLDANTF